MTYLSLFGTIGGLILVFGAAYPAKPIKHPLYSRKNQLLTLGAIFLFSYAILNYLYGNGIIFFIFLESLAIVASAFMLSNTSEKISSKIIIGLGVFFIGLSIYLYRDINTALFVVGLSGISLGYVLKAGTSRRNLSLCLGSLLIAILSFREANWIFFWLNIFFAIFSGYYFFKLKTTNH